MQTRMKTNSGAKLMMRVAAALLFAGCLPAAYGQHASASGRLYVHGSVDASYRVEITAESYTSVSQGIASGNSLRAQVLPGPITVRVLKANSDSASYSLDVTGGRQDLSLRQLPYAVAVPVVIPDSKTAAPLVLSVLPD
ncbi:MAG TPA: hypothetical protein VG096_02845 [Bryobacteraceae bacterium]|nr:hypothetical protein [Bryobacteraceae bacterium]